MLLSLDASLPHFSWCLQSDNQILAEDASPLKHYENLPHYLQQIFEQHHIVPQDIQQLAIIKGPGNYTGLRASLALVRTWHLVWGTPVVCKNRLETMLYHVCQTESKEVAIAQAVRMNEYFILKGKKTEHGFDITHPLEKINGQQWDSYLKDATVFGDAPPEKSGIQESVQWTHLSPVLAQWTLETASYTPLEAMVPFYTRAAVQNK